MEFLKSQLSQFQAFWAQTSPQSRFGMIATLLICVGLIIGVGYWSSQPHYVSVRQDLAPEEMGQIIDALDKKGIANKTSPYGTSVLVPQSKLSQARAAIANIDGGITPEASNGILGGSLGRGERRAKLIRQKEHELAEALAGFKAIEEAKVQLQIGERHAIQTMQTDSTASVRITLSPGEFMNYRRGQAIVDFISNAVDGLQPENVTLLDDRLNPFNFESGDGIANGAMKSEIETALKRSAERLLDKMLGPGNSEVEVIAKVKIKSAQTESKTFEPTKILTSSLQKTVTGSMFQGNGGPTGTTANLTNSASPGGIAVPQKSEELTNKYHAPSVEISKITEHPDVIERLSIAAVVDPYIVDENGESVKDPEFDETKVAELIKNAVGYDETRNDQFVLHVRRMADDNFLAAEEESSMDPAFLLEIIRNSSLGLGALFALVIGFLMLRKLKPITLTQSEAQISPERARALADLSKGCQSKPGVHFKNCFSMGQRSGFILQ